MQTQPEGRESSSRRNQTLILDFQPLEICDSLIAQSVKNLPAMQETWVRSLGQEDPLEESMTPTLVFLPGESHGQRSLADYSPQGCEESDTTEATSHTRTPATQSVASRHSSPRR